MKIAFDLRRKTGFGVGTYIRNVMRTLARVDAPGGSGPGNSYVLIGTPDRLREFRGLPENFILQAAPTPSSTWKTSLAFRKLLQSHQCDLLHIPHMFKTPRVAHCPYVVTVHDVLDFIERRPQQAPWQRRLRLEMARYALARSSAIMAVSHSTKSDLLRLFGGALSPEKIHVAHNALDERLSGGHSTPEERQFIAERYQVTYPFLLYAGDIKPHKNVVKLIEAFSALKAELKKEDKLADLKLIIIGNEISSHPHLRRTMIKSGVQNDIRFLGFVPIETLRTFYDVAKVFVFPSLYEGFGLPPLEAMAQGTPVVTSNTSSLPEVVGNAAVLVNPENVFEIMHGIKRALLDQQLRETLKQRGYAQAARFSWETSVRSTLAVYGGVGAKSGQSAR
ncbi:MAG TPA: glycosyltransferase family 1 protein [Terriglobales bacterium]|nr:glycosyltransferase family 1 protein [Terriglobales bacterium]